MKEEDVLEFQAKLSKNMKKLHEGSFGLLSCENR
jgi:hypothetical protein